MTRLGVGVALGLALACAPLRYGGGLPEHGAWSDCPNAPPPAQPLRALVLALEMSTATQLPSGFDVDGDGAVGLDNQRWLPGRKPIPKLEAEPESWSTDPEDSVLHAELAAARALLADAGLSGTAVGLVAYAGNLDTQGVPRGDDSPDAMVLTSVIPRHALVQDDLERIQRRGSRGGANLAAAIEAGAELLAAYGAASDPPQTGGTLLLLGLGAPTLPGGNGLVRDAEDQDAAQAAAVAAQRQGVALRAALFGGGEEELRFLGELTGCVGGRAARLGPFGSNLGDGLARLLIEPPAVEAGE